MKCQESSITEDGVKSLNFVSGVTTHDQADNVATMTDEMSKCDVAMKQTDAFHCW